MNSPRYFCGENYGAEIARLLRVERDRAHVDDKMNGRPR